MKRFNKYLMMIATLAMLSVACNPLEDELTAIEASRVEVQDVLITLTDDDYDLINKECDCANGNFGNIEDVKSYVPLALTDNFPALGKGSSALVTYNFYRGGNEAVKPYTDAVKALRYEVSSADYLSVSAEAGNAGFFNNTTTFEDNISNILNANVDTLNNGSDIADGQMIAVKYQKAEIEYADLDFTEIYAEDFSGITDLDASNFIIFDKKGAESWHKYVSSFPYEAARISGFGGTGNEDWLITPEIDLTSFNSAELRINQVVAFLDPAIWGTDIAIRASADYDGISDPSTATWKNLEFNRLPTNDDGFDPVDGKASLAEFGGEKIHIAFYYTATDDFAPNWRVIDINVSEGDVDVVTKNEFYSYNAMSSKWSKVESNAYFLSSADYNKMGAPGTFDNFSSSINPDNYLPVFLNSYLPYAQEGDEQIIIYDYFSSSSGAQVRGDFYSYTGGSWAEYAFEVESTLAFGHDGTTWVPDNTIKYTFTTADFNVAGDEANGLGNAAARDNLRSFGNFGTQWSHEEIVEAIGFVLKLNFPNSEVGQKYLVTYNTYPAGDLTTHLELMESGDYVEIE